MVRPPAPREGYGDMSGIAPAPPVAALSGRASGSTGGAFPLTTVPPRGCVGRTGYRYSTRRTACRGPHAGGGAACTVREAPRVAPAATLRSPAYLTGRARRETRRGTDRSPPAALPAIDCSRNRLPVPGTPKRPDGVAGRG